VEVITRMRELQEKLKVVDGPDPLSREAQRNATLLFLSHLRAIFASKRVLREYKLTPEAFNWILGEIETRFNSVSCQHTAHLSAPPPF
jgi:DNA-directed RNA polymerase II subunit RPB1